MKAESDILDLIKKEKEKRETRGLRTSINMGVTLDPDATAKKQILANQLSLPMDVIEGGEKQATEAASIQNLLGKLKDSAKLRKTYSDPDVAAIAHDDVDNLAELDRISMGEYAGGVFGEASMRDFSAVAGIKALWADYFGDDLMKERAIDDYRLTKEAAEMVHPDFQTGTAEGIYSGLVSTVSQSKGLLAGALLRNPAVPLAYIGLQTFGESYGKYRERGGTAGEALSGGGLEAAIEVGTELAPMKFLFKAWPGGKAGVRNFLTGLFGREIIGEQAATLGQELVDTMIANPDKSFRDYVNEIPRNAYQTLIATVTQTTLMGGAGAGSSYLSRRRQYQLQRTDEDYKQADKALADQAQLDAEVDAAQKTKLIKRGKVGQDALMNHLTNTLGAENEVHLEPSDAKIFFQTHPEVLDNLTDATRASAIEGIQSESGVAIPKAEYIAYVSQYHEELSPYLRNDIDGMTAAEAEQWAETAEEQVTQEAEETIKEMDEGLEALVPDAPETQGFNLGPKMDEIMMPEVEMETEEGDIVAVKYTAEQAMQQVEKKTTALEKLQACING